MKTEQEIIDRIRKIKDRDFFGFESIDLITRLPFSSAKEFLKPETVEADWKQATMSPSEEIKSYLSFAWDKANNCRGLSASRSISHFTAWMFLDGKDEFLKYLEDEGGEYYEHYGKGLLVLVSTLYDVDWRKLDDGIWTNDEMSAGITAEARDALVKTWEERARA